MLFLGAIASNAAKLLGEKHQREEEQVRRALWRVTLPLEVKPTLKQKLNQERKSKIEAGNKALVDAAADEGNGCSPAHESPAVFWFCVWRLEEFYTGRSLVDQ